MKLEYPDFANMDSRVNNNLLGYYVSGGNIGKQLNIAAGLKVSGHLSHPNPLRSRGPNDINVQGTNISMEAMRAQGFYPTNFFFALIFHLLEDDCVLILS